jgi:hypothetical protein
MEHWQFLIQKQGDRSWQSLESPNLKILAGRYRVLARSHLPNTDVEVRVTHSPTQEVPSKRRILKRMRRTNAEGLLAVIPFTYLKPGIWELRCSGDLMSDIFGKSWQHSILMQVLPQVFNGEPTELDSLASTSQNQTDLPNESELADLVTDQPVSPVWLKGETAEQILQNLIDLALPNSELSQSDGNVEDFPATPILQLALDRENYVARWGERIAITGQVTLPESPTGETLFLDSVGGLELVIEMRSPWESQTLTQVRQPLPDNVLPFSFSTAIDIPAECESKLILADISLYGRLADVDEVVLLASQSFTVTADVTELLAMTAKTITPGLLDENILTGKTKEAEPSVRLGLELFNLVKYPKTIPSQPWNPATSKPLPPLINSQALESELNKSVDEKLPQLPKLPQNPTPTTSTNEVAASPVSNNSVAQTISAIDLQKLEIRNRRGTKPKTTLPYLKRLKTVQVDKAPKLNLPQLEKSLQLNNTGVEEQPTPELVADHGQLPDESRAEVVMPVSGEVTTKGGDLVTVDQPNASPLLQKWMHSQGYFFSQPVSVAYPESETDEPTAEVSLVLSEEAQIEQIELPLILNAEIEVAVVVETDQVEVDHVSTETADLPPIPPQVPPTWLTQEFVVDDDMESIVETSISQTSTPDSQPPLDLSRSLPMNGIVNDPLPIPHLYVPEGELIAGQSVKVRVELPAASPPLVVKLWIEDCQTRWLLDGPHLLSDLLPNSFGSLEMMTQLNVPFGCLEIRVEAIALDLATQQESHKVTIVRTVIPPDLPSLQLDELLEI